jgi:ubiquinone/menaquinone biosynthesis C-methylase UbiE
MIREGDHFERVAQAFSYKASIYDGFGEGHPNLLRMRQKVYAHVLRHAQPGARILEINAGTGTDAAYFAAQGFNIYATDISTGMLNSILAKITRQNLIGRLSAQRLSFTDLLAVEGKPYDYLFSNFGGLNCIADLSRVAAQLPVVLRPGGRLTWVVMPPIHPWGLAQAFRGDFRTAFRRLSRGGTQANVEGVRFQVNYFTPGQVLRSLGPRFRLLELEGLSIFTPPADHKEFALRWPGLYSFLVKVDDFATRLPLLRNWGDFFILSAEYCG